MTSRDSLIVNLRILRAEGISASSRSSRLPNVYVKVEMESFSSRTKTVKRTTGPKFDDNFRFAASLSSILKLRVKHDSTIPLQKHLLGSADIEIGKLIESSKLDPDVVLKLEASDNQECGQIIVRVSVDKEAVNAGTAAVDEAVQNIKDKLHGDKLSASKSFGIVVAQLQVLHDIINQAAKVHPYVNVAWKVTSAVYKIVEGQLDRDKKIADLVEAMEHIYTFVNDIKSFPEKIKSLEEVIKSILQQTFECALFIQEYTGCGFAKRMAKQTLSDKGSQIDGFIQNLVELKKSFDTGVNVQIAVVSARIQDKVEAIARRQILDALKPADMDPYGRDTCLPGTREDLLGFVATWAMNAESEHNILWLNGVAGSGKSTIATTLAYLFQEINRLGAFIFFDRNVSARSNPALVIRTLAHQLGMFSHRLGTAIADAIDSTPSIFQGHSLLQFTKLLVETFSSAQEVQAEGPIVILIDALDECGRPQDRKVLLKVLAEESAKLPFVLRIIITSRPEYDIHKQFDTKQNILSHKLNIRSDDTRTDIEAFFRHELTVIRMENDWLPSHVNWPGNSRIQALVERASGLFIWASTACKFIDAHDPDSRLRVLLQASTNLDAESALDELYTMALQSAGEWKDPDLGADFRAVVGTILVARNPLSADAINTLAPLNGHRPTSLAIRKLECVLHFNSVVRVLHPSFADFLSNKDRCTNEAWYIDVASHKLRFASQCLDFLDVHLKYNICDIELSLSPINTSFLEDMDYACTFWVDHICAVEDANLIADRLEGFMFKHLLHWIEAMSVLKKSRDTIRMTQSLLDWIDKSLPERIRLRDLVYDAHRFVQSFIGCIEQHPLLVYTTGLPFSPVDTALYRNFSDPTRFPWIAGGFERSWTPLLLTLPHDVPARSVAFSSDGTRVASGHDDGTIRIWDLGTSSEVIQPIRAQKNRCSSLAFSPDGARLVTAQGDVYVWDTASGEQVLGPLLVGRGFIISTMFSPDGKLIACTTPRTVCIWDAVSGAEMFDRLSGPDHPDSICSLAFSSDSTRILIGSREGKICGWYTGSGDNALGPVQAQSKSVRALQFCSAGDTFVSVGEVDEGSLAQAFDAQSGTCISTILLKGATCEEYSHVSLSADGSCVLLADSWQKWKGEISVWDTASGDRLLATKQHLQHGNVKSVILSPDGKNFLSAADKSLCLWGATKFQDFTDRQLQLSKNSPPYSSDATNIVISLWIDETTQQISNSNCVVHVASGNIVSKHVGPPGSFYNRSIALSADGSQIASTWDHIIGIWETSSGQLIHTITPEPNIPEAWVDAAEFALDGKQILCAVRNGTIQIWDVHPERRVLSISPPWSSLLPRFKDPAKSTDFVASVAFSPDGVKIVSATRDGYVHVWDAKTGICILGPLSSVHSYLVSVGFSSDAMEIAARSSLGEIDKWEADTGKVVDTRPTQTAGICRALDRFVVESPSGWIKDEQNHTFLSCIPPSINLSDIQATSSSDTSMTIVTRNSFFIVHFPPIMLAKPGDAT